MPELVRMTFHTSDILHTCIPGLKRGEKNVGRVDEGNGFSAESTTFDHRGSLPPPLSLSLADILSLPLSLSGLASE